jgi:hypothetical protein
MGTWTTPAGADADAWEENEDRAVDVADAPYRYFFRTAERETATVPVRRVLIIIEVMLIAVVTIYFSFVFTRA